jgi:hypothetical protein
MNMVVLMRHEKKRYLYHHIFSLLLLLEPREGIKVNLRETYII